MLKVLGSAFAIAMLMVACGGGGGGGASGGSVAAKQLTISFYGQPMVSAATSATAAARAIMADAGSGASAPQASSDASATVQDLQSALVQRGVSANVSVGVMDGTTLHQIVIGENNGLPPTPDQFKTVPSEWLIINFQLDDMVTPMNTPAQQAALAQFQQDVVVFTQRANVAGKRVFAVLPIPTCDQSINLSPSLVLDGTLQNLQGVSTIGVVGQTINYGIDGFGNLVIDKTHLGADCRTPDAYLQNMRVQSVADEIATRYALPSTPASSSGASAPSS